ncbi:S-adenosyl-L-methionine-dependent methyltransferase [Sistotremastrum suecicum HHB10207 ss-3]|uniref:S-adenosyl-L-methionine-dependent methyltransferase n=1 Tax=Sistotremastrum suecicum HHB10207 ss-3 TaxID=1314776 RepID=A0A165ZYQ2_9AGAM|nr:S-adenosyl-L-methionine-dependent methyltransferase [Sistotremastrum suecicum HHB10207 ss-3]
MSTLALKEVHGRGMNGTSDIYKLPADIKEMDRLALQHQMWKLMMDGLTPVTADELDILLASTNGVQAAVLDLGCGSGSWCIDMARAYPHARVVGFDLAPVAPRDTPPNCSFSRGDWSNGLFQFRNQFNLVYTRSVLGHLTAEARVKAINEAVDCLRPGGLIILSDGDHIIMDANKQPAAPASETDCGPSRSWMARFMQEVNSYTWKLNEVLGTKFPSWLASNNKLDQATINYQMYHSPINWDGGDIKYGAQIGHMMYINCKDFIRAWRPMFKTNGWSDEEINRLVSRVDEEVDGPQVHIYIRWHAAWARKLS